MSLLQRIRSGPRLLDNTYNIEEEAKVAQQVQPKKTTIASLVGQPPPPPTVPNPKQPKKKPPTPTPTPTTTSGGTTMMSETALISKVYGPTANIYTEILSVDEKASQQEIREAFFCLRYGIYQQLSEDGEANGPLSPEERKKMEMKMDAISAAFQILSDRNKRKMYDKSLAQRRGGGGGQGGALVGPTRDSPSKQLQEEAKSNLSIAQKRSSYRRQMNAQQRRPIEGGLNSRKAPSAVLMGEMRQEEEEVPAANVKKMSIREQMMGEQSKKMSVKTTEEVHEDYEEDSPTAVDEFDSMNKFKNIKLDGDTKKSNDRRQDSPEPDERSYGDDSGTYDDDSRTYGTYDDRTYDDDQTYGDESYYTYGETTLGTYDDSTYISYDDQTYGTYDDRGKYKPSHKSGDKPEPILKSGDTSKNKKKGDRRVTIHSHRGKGEAGEDGCPMPAFDDAFEELNGTYKDFKATLNQVGSAFILSPDDIDKMSDKIRDARHELWENYEAKQKKQTAPNKQKKGTKPKSKPKKATVKN